MNGSQLFQFFSKHVREIDTLGYDVDAQAQPGPIEIAQVIKQRLHPGPATYQAACCVRYSLPGIQCFKIRSSRQNRLERAAHVVPEHAKQKITALLDLRAEKVDRFRKCLIDRLIEANDVVQMRRV